MRRAAAAVAALLAVASASCCGCAVSPTFTVRRDAALHPPAAPALAGPTARVLHLGDFGDPTCQQEVVARAVVDAHGRRPFDLALFSGDDIYPCGPDLAIPGAEACRFADDGNTVAPGFSPPQDPSFGRHEDALAPLAAAPAVPIRLALGNHDVGSCGAADPQAAARLRACLEVAHASPLWSMPGRHYVVDLGGARFIVFDSNLVARGDYGGFTLDDEVAFVASAAAGCDARTCFLVGHHPPVTAGAHRDEVGSAAYVERMGRLLRAGGGRIRAFLAGHDHDLQHLRTGEGLDVLVSGNGSGSRAAEKFQGVSRSDARLLFASVRWGYGVLEVGASGWRYRFEGDDGAPLYCCAAVGSGTCEPVACP